MQGAYAGKDRLVLDGEGNIVLPYSPVIERMPLVGGGVESCTDTERQDLFSDVASEAFKRFERLAKAMVYHDAMKRGADVIYRALPFGAPLYFFRPSEDRALFPLEGFEKSDKVEVYSGESAEEIANLSWAHISAKDVGKKKAKAIKAKIVNSANHYKYIGAITVLCDETNEKLKTLPCEAVIDPNCHAINSAVLLVSTALLGCGFNSEVTFCDGVGSKASLLFSGGLSVSLSFVGDGSFEVVVSKGEASDKFVISSGIEKMAFIDNSGNQGTQLIQKTGGKKLSEYEKTWHLRQYQVEKLQLDLFLVALPLLTKP